MISNDLNEREKKFSESLRALFLQQALNAMGFQKLEDVPTSRRTKPTASTPTLIDDYRRLSTAEIDELGVSFFGAHGTAYFITLNPDAPSEFSHPLIAIAAQLADVLPLRFPVTHPMEGHKEARMRFGEPDGTLKIYDLDTNDGSKGYREQAETSEKFDAHNDGLGYAGAVESFALYANSAPLYGGYTYFQNIIRLSIELAKTDFDAFSALFLPDAISALRPRGKGAIKVTTPILFVNEHKRPQCFLRLPTGEYSISYRENCPSLERAVAFLNDHAEPFAEGSSFVHLDRKGAGVFARNEWVVHGRTPFVNGTHPQERRVLARKWFMSAQEHTTYKHVPGMHIWREIADLLPDRFSVDKLQGDWNYDRERRCNVRVG